MSATSVACGLDVVGQLVPGDDASGDAGADASGPRPDAGGNTDVDGETEGDASDASADSAADVSIDAMDAADSAVSAGTALSFATNQYVDVGTSLGIPADFTIEAWVRPTSYAGEKIIVAKDRVAQGAGQCRLGVDANGRLFFILTDSGGDDHGLYNSGYVLQATNGLPLGTWSHVAVTKMGSTFALLIGGASVDTLTASSSFVYGGPAVSFRIGARVASDGTSAADGFNGAIDEVRVWNVARTSTAISMAMKSVVDPATPGLVASFRFSEGTGTTTANAKSGTAATLVNGPTWIASTAF